MKHIFILISILLLFSPLYGQSKKSGLLYIWENGSRYVGDWKDGKKHGQGTYTYGKGQGEGDKYVGEFKGGFKNGQGKYIWSNGDKYVGVFKDDKNQMVKEHTLGLMEEGMMGNSRMEKGLVKEPLLHL